MAESNDLDNRFKILNIIKSNNRAAVWKYFGFVDMRKTYLKCVLCEASLKYMSNTTNMRSHLRAKHRASFLTLDQNNSKVEGQPSFTSCEDSSFSADAFKSDSLLSALNINSSHLPSFQGEQGSFKDTPQYQKITENLVQYLCKGMHPISILKEPEFQSLLNSLNPHFSVPAEDEMNQLITKFYNEVKNSVETEVRQATDMCIAFHIWKSCSNNDYLEVAVHFITSNWTVKKYLLENRELPFSHSTESIFHVLKCILTEWNIERVGIMVSNNTPNGIGAIEVELAQIECFGSILNNLVKLAMESGMILLIEKCIKLAEFFQQSAEATFLFEENQKFLNPSDVPVTKLLQKYEVQWNSIFLMVKSIVEREQAIFATITSLENCSLISEGEMIILEQLLHILKPFAAVTEDLSSESFVCISLLMPTLYELQKCLGLNDGDESIIIKIKKSILEDISERYSGKEKKILLLSTLLDPRLKALPFLDIEERFEIHSLLKEKMINKLNKVSSDEYAGTSSSDCNSPSSAKRFKGTFHLLRNVYNEDCVVKNSQSVEEKADDELQRYLASASIALTSDPFSYWSANCSLYPTISSIAHDILSAPATSIPPNKLFTKSGFVVNCNRAKLNSNAINVLSFLNYNS